MKRFILVLVLGISVLGGEKIDKDEIKKFKALLGPFVKPVKVDQKWLKDAEKKIKLGRVLFYDNRLNDQNVSCNSCHDLTKYGTNGEYYLKQFKAGKIIRDVPALFNKSNLMMYDWVGGTKSLEDKIESSLFAKTELAVDKDKLILKLKQSEEYSKLFKEAFPNDKEALSLKNVKTALAEFIRGLIAPSPLDEFLSGKDDALTKDQLKGGKLFDEKMCSACHTGRNFGGQMRQKLGMIEKWPNQKDLGYYHVKKDPRLKMTFRVSPLRNVAKTGPYFHDRTSKDLTGAIIKMARYELGKFMSFRDAVYITEFLESLTGKIPQDYIKKPTLPKMSGK